METLKVILVATLLCTTLSGCLGDDTASSGKTDEAPDTPPLAPAVPTVIRVPVEMLVAVGEQNNPVAAASIQGPFPNNGGAWNVPASATHMIVEGTWTCQGADCAYRVEIRSPDAQPFSEVVDGNVRYETDFSEGKHVGEWSAALLAHGPHVETQGEFRISIFTEAPLEGYTAF